MNNPECVQVTNVDRAAHSAALFHTCFSPSHWTLVTTCSRNLQPYTFWIMRATLASFFVQTSSFRRFGACNALDLKDETKVYSGSTTHPQLYAVLHKDIKSPQGRRIIMFLTKSEFNNNSTNSEFCFLLFSSVHLQIYPS